MSGWCSSQVLLRGSKGHNFDEFKTVINAMASGRISVKKYISRRIKLEEVQAGFEAMKAPAAWTPR